MVETSRIGADIDRIPAPAFFVVGALTQYAGAALAVGLFDQLGVVPVAWLRVLSSGIILLAVRRFRPVTHWRMTVVFGVTLAAMNLSYYLAIERLPLGTATAIEFCGPIAVASFGARSRRGIAALGLAVSGVALLADVQWQASPLGVLAALGAAAGWAGYIMLGKRMAGIGGGSGGGIDGLAWSMLAGGVALSLLGAPSLVSSPGPVTVGVVAGCALVGVLSNVIPYAFDQIVLTRMHSSQFALLLALLPVTATLVGFVALGQVPVVAEFVGIGAVMVAVAIRPR